MVITKRPPDPHKSQHFLNFAAVEDGLIILRGGGLRLVLLCSSLNFALKSEQEQNALVFQYQNFLNSLSFPIQILVQSRKLDLSTYLTNLDLLRQNQPNDLLRIQMADYISFVKKLIEVANIMDKKFFVVLGRQPTDLKPEGLLAKLRSGRAHAPIPITEEQFAAGRDELRERANVIAGGLASMGIRAIQLNTRELIELLYQSYNPDTAATQKLGDQSTLTAPIVQAQKGPA